MLTMVEYVHERIKSHGDFGTGVDFTMGNGNDTSFLLEFCQEVYAFDIQEKAIEKTKELIQDNKRATLILDNHKNVKQYINSFDIGIFNLGYLPEGNHEVTTLLESTQIALKEAVEMMNKVLFVVVYPGHPQGQEEALWIEDFVSQLDGKIFNVSKYCMMNKKNSPFVIEIEKRP